MSEAQKPVETAPVAPVVAEVAPVVEPAAPVTDAAAAAAAPATEAPKDTTVEPEVPAKDEVKAEITPATDGTLGHKAPGLVKSLRFAKRYFWFSDDAVEAGNLSHYLQNEKLSVAHPTAAWASQTGKGLLFFAKRPEDKTHPTGIINLAEISDVVKEGVNKLSFKWNGHKHAFQASSADERDSWVVALEKNSTEGKAAKEGLVDSEAYKAELEKFTKPGAAVVAPSSPKKSLEARAKDVVKKVEGEVKAKSRSQSRKRASIFGAILGKKEDTEAKKEEKAEGEEVKKVEAEPTPEEPAVAVAPAAVAATTEAAPVTEPAEVTPAVEHKTEEAPKRPEIKAKRNSMFGTLFQKVTSQGHGKADKEPAIKAPETTVSSTAPQLDDPVHPATAEPIQPESVTQPEATTEPAKEVQEETATSPSSIKGGFLNFMKKNEDKKEAKSEEKAEKKAEESPAEEPAAATSEPAPGATLKERRRTSFFGNFGTKREKKVETSEGEPTEASEPPKVRSPSIPRLGGLFRKPSKAVKKEKEPAVAAEGEASTEVAPAAAVTETVKDTTAAVNGTEEPEIKPAPATAPVAQPVQAAA
ncbi:hypothetical protein LOZ53_005906 [Ophidiomyces ophidiicola]|nr:hypothetical protein LOZ53_005906 [Ophidiomyces ophidiicola]